MENKMTAVEWLEYMWINGEHYSIESVMEWFEKAKQMEKTQIQVKYKFNPGDHVWAISRYHDDGKPTDHLAIYPAVIESVTLYKDNVYEYWLQTPDGKSWGTAIGQEIFDSFEEAIAYVKLEWEKNCNTF